MTNRQASEFQESIGEIDRLVQDLERLPDARGRDAAKGLAQRILDLHATGIERMLEVIYESQAAGQALIDELAGDETVSSLLLLHDLHPLGVETRVERALEQVRPYMRSHGGDVELLGIGEDGVVRLRLEGSCHGCASSRVTLKQAVEQAISRAAPDVTAIEAEGAVEAPPPIPNFVPLTQVKVAAKTR